MKKVKDKESLIEKWEYAAIPAVKFTQQKIDCRGLISAGSCFSRNLNRWLMHSGLTELQMPWGILYNPFSITMEIIRLFDKVDWQNGIIYETDKVGKIIRYKDPCLFCIRFLKAKKMFIIFRCMRLYKRFLNRIFKFGKKTADM